MNYAPFLAAFLAGLMSGGHCIGMCGGIVSLLNSAADSPTSSRRVWLQNLGRLTTYTTLGALMGFSSAVILQWLPSDSLVTLFRNLTAVFIVLVGLTLIGWTRMETLSTRYGSYVWRHIQPQFIRTYRIKSHFGHWLTGVLWGFLPCGMVYAMLPGAALTAQATQGAALMLSFGLGTLPWLTFFSQVSKPLFTHFRQNKIRQISGLMLITLGLIALFLNTAPNTHLLHTH